MQRSIIIKNNSTRYRFKIQNENYIFVSKIS